MNQPNVTKSSMGQTIVVVVSDGAKVLGWESGDGLTLPIVDVAHSTSRGAAIDDAIRTITAHTGLLFERIPNDTQYVEDSSSNNETIAIHARVVGGTMPTVPIHAIQMVEWVEPSTFVGSSKWPLFKNILTHFDLWEPSVDERMRAVVFGSWVHHPGHPTPPNSTTLDVAVGYFGKTRPTYDELQAFGERKGREWGEKNLLSTIVQWDVHVHHGLQKPTPDGLKVDKVEFLLPERVGMWPGHISIKTNPHARREFAVSTHTNPNYHDPRAVATRVIPWTNHRVDPHVMITRVIPWAYGAQALSLSTLLFSAGTVSELVNMWRHRPVPIILRLDEPCACDRLDASKGFGLLNLRNAIRHSAHRQVFEHAMNHVPWGELVRKLATKDPNQEHMRWLWGTNEPSATLLLFSDGVARVRREKMFGDYNRRREEELRQVVEGFSVDGVMDGGYGKERLGPAFIREPIPYHTICREMFRKG